MHLKRVSIAFLEEDTHTYSIFSILGNQQQVIEALKNCIAPLGRLLLYNELEYFD